MAADPAPPVGPPRAADGEAEWEEQAAYNQGWSDAVRSVTRAVEAIPPPRPVPAAPPVRVDRPQAERVAELEAALRVETAGILNAVERARLYDLPVYVREDLALIRRSLARLRAVLVSDGGDDQVLTRTDRQRNRLNTNLPDGGDDQEATDGE